jgi:hypothetical protein
MVEARAVAVVRAALHAVVVAAVAASPVCALLARVGLSAASAGDLVLAAWAVGMGLLALYVGVVALGYEQALPRLRRLAAGE